MRKLSVCRWVSPVRQLARRWCQCLCTALLPLVLAGCQVTAPQLTLAGSGELWVRVSGLRNDQGAVVVSLFTGEKGFPDDAAASMRTLSLPILNAQAEASFPGLPYGEYALSVLHDEDGDGEMATGFLGTPREGFGFSEHPDYRFGHPSFAETRFLLVSPHREVEVLIRYETGRREHQESGQSSGAHRPEQ